ncbi:MAG: hypothetical protein LW805_12130 [Oxalobacteraceae bacterium]|nr:hypothetical protein [Oxalobacteraceae bacterium]
MDTSPRIASSLYCLKPALPQKYYLLMMAVWTARICQACIQTLNTFSDPQIWAPSIIFKTCFIGADNWLRSDAIELLSNENADIVTYDIMVTGELKEEILTRVPGETRPYQGDLYWDRQDQHHGSMMYRTALGQKVGYERRYENGLHPQEDWNLWDKMLEQGATVSSLKEGLLFYRRHRENFLKYGCHDDHSANSDTSMNESA